MRANLGMKSSLRLVPQQMKSNRSHLFRGMTELLKRENGRDVILPFRIFTGGRALAGRLTVDQMKPQRFIQIGFHLKSSQLFYREIFDRLWYITITERKKARTAKIWLQRSCRFNSCRGHHIAPWCRWLTRLPVTQEIAGSSPVGVAIRPLSLTVEHRFKKRALYMSRWFKGRTCGR